MMRPHIRLFHRFLVAFLLLSLLLAALPAYAQEAAQDVEVAAPGLSRGVLLIGLGVVGFLGAYIWWRKYMGKGDLD